MATKKTKPINWDQLASDLGVVPEWQKQRLDQPVAAPAPAPASEPRPINWDELASDLGVVSEWKWQRPEPTTIVSAPTTPAPQPAPSGPSLFGRRVSLPQLPRIVQAPAQRPAMTWGAQPLGQAPQPVAPAPSYPAISSPLATVRPPSRPMTADYLQRARAALSKRQAPYWEQTLADKGYPAPAALTPAARTLERYRQLFGKTLPLSILYGPIVGGYQAMPAAQGQEVAPQQPGAERTAYMGIQGALSGASLGALPITEQARNTQEQVAQVGGQFAGAALPWEAAFRLVGAPAAIAAGPAGEALGNAAARLAARLGAREGTRQGTRALTQFLTREAARGAAAGAAATAPTLLTEPAKTPEEAARRVGGAVLSAAAVSAGLPLVGEAVSRFGARPIARMVGDRLRTFIPTGEAVAGSEVDLASAGYRFVKGRGNVPGLWVKQEPTTGLHYGVRVERRVTPGGNVETTYQTFQEAPRGAKAGPKPAEAGPVIDVTAKPAGEPAAPQAAAPAAPAQEPAATPQEPVRTTAAPAEPVATEAPASTSAEVPGPSPNVPATVQEERSGAKVDGMLQVKYPPTKQTQAALKTVPKPVWGSFQRSGITRVEIVAPNELPLSAVADVSPSQGILRINANAGSMTEDIGQTIAHEIGHVVYSRMTPEQRDNIKAAAVLYPDIVKRVAPGYASTGASEEVISELYAEAVLHPKSLPEDLRAALLAEPQGQAPAPAAATEAEITNVPRLPAPHKSWKQVAADYHGQVDPEADLAKLIEKDGDVPLVLKDANGGRHVVMASVWNSQLRHDPLVTGNIREVFLPANGPVEPRIDTHTLPYLPDLAEGLRRGIAAAIEDGNTSAAKLLPALPAPKGEVLKADLPPVALVRYEEGAEQKEAPELVAAAERQNQAIEGGGGFWVGRAFFGQSENREPIWVISSGTYEFAPAADWLEVPTRDKQQHIYILASPKARPTNAPEAEPTQAKEPWQITRAEFQLNENRQKYEVIVSALEANKKLVLGTQYRGTVLTKPEHVRLNKQGEVQVMFGAKWVFLTSPQLNDLAARAGMKIPDFGERVYHRDIVEKALADGKPVPDEVLKDYPDLTEPEEVASLAEPLGPLNEAARGSDVTAETERGTKVQLHYAIAEASDLVASHDTALRRNPDYPAELQPRDRGRIASEEQVSRIASKLNPVRLGESPMVADGAPVVGPDGVVESGNGRVIALQRVYDQEHANAGKYRQWLLDNAEKFGLDKAAIEGTQAPVLVRVRDTEVDRVKFTQEANEQAVASMSATEKAKNDAKKLTGVLMAQFVPNETGEIDTPANRAAFIQNFMEKVVSDAERGELMQDNAKINQAGVIRIRNAIFAKAYGDITIIEKLAESTDNNVRNLTNAMLVAAPRLAAIKEGIAGGRFYDLDLTGDIAAAVNTLSMLREAGQTVDEYFRQPAILKGTLTDLGKDLLDVFEANGRSTKKLSSILLAYADMVEAVGDPRYGSDLLGRTVAPTRAEVLTAALRKVEFGSEGQATLLEGETAGGPETGANPPALGEEQGQGRPEFGDQTQQVAHLVIRKGESGALRSALDAQGKIRVGLDSITIKADARVPADVAQAVKDAARGWEVVRNRDGSVILRRPAGPSQAVVREVEALYEREGVREGADPEKSKHLARRVLEDISSGGDSSGGTSAEGLRPRVRTRGRAASLAKNLGSGVRTLGVGIQGDLAKKGFVEFRGRAVKTAEDLAQLAQIVRDPRVETFRIFYVRGDTVVAHEAVTSNLPGLALVFKPESERHDIGRMLWRMKRFNADGYWVLHNHPSGRPRPSQDDVKLSLAFAEKVPGLKGSVIINSGRYGVLDGGELSTDGVEVFKKAREAKQGTPEQRQALQALRDWVDAAVAKSEHDFPGAQPGATDALLTPSLAHPLLGTPLRGAQDVVSIGQSLKTPDNYVVLIYRTATGTVRALQEIPVALFRQHKEASDYIRGRMREFGSLEALAYYSGSQDAEVETASHIMIATRVLRDAVIDRRSLLTQGAARLEGWTAGLPDAKIPRTRIQEDSDQYLVGPEFFLNEPTRTESAGTGAFAGASPTAAPANTLSDVERDLASQVDEAQGEIGGPAGLSIRLVGARPGNRDAGAPLFAAADPEVERRIQDAHGAPRESVWQRVRETVASLQRKAAGKYEWLPRNVSEFADLRRALNKLEAQKDVTAYRVARLQQGILLPLQDPKEFDLFERAVLLADLAEEVEVGHERLPYGYTPEKVRKDRARIEEVLRQHPDVQQALDQRKRVWNAIKDEYVKAQEAIGHHVADRLQRESYFRHQVLAYANLERIRGTGSRLRTPTGRGYLKHREGSSLDINSHYLEVDVPVMAQMLYDVEIAKTIALVQTPKYNIFNQLQAEAKRRNAALPEGAKPVTWEDLVPDGYVAWQPREGNLFYSVDSVPARLAEKLWEGTLQEVGITADDLNKVLAVGGKLPVYVVREEVAKTLDNLTRNPAAEDPVSRAARWGVGAWKQWTLLWPKRVVAYNARNLTGDLDAALQEPGILKKLPQAFKELSRVSFGDGAMSDELRQWFERGGMESTLSIQEAGAVRELKMFQALMGRKGSVTELPLKVIQGYFRGARRITAAREALLRYAAYLHYLDQLQASKTGLPKSYAASVPEEIKGLSDPRDRAYVLSNDLLGAYDEVSVLGQWFRAHLGYFWSFQEINLRRYGRLLRNAARDEGLARAAARRFVPGLVVRAPLLAYRIGGFLLKASLLWAALQAYNLTRYPDEEKALPADVRGRPHIILGRDATGKIRYLDRLAAVSDFLEWFGLDAPQRVVTDYLDGRKSLKEIAVDMAKAPVNKLVQALGPVVKVPVEAATGKRTYPNVFAMGTVRDQGQNLASTFGLQEEYGRLAGLPSRPWNWQADPSRWFLGYKVSDPGETAYYDTLDLKYEYLRSKGKESTFAGSITERSQALYNVRLAARYGDKESFVRYLAQYADAGGTKEGLSTSFRNLDPLHGLNKDDKKEFEEKYLNDEERKRLQEASAFYHDVILKNKQDYASGIK